MLGAMDKPVAYLQIRNERLGTMPDVLIFDQSWFTGDHGFVGTGSFESLNTGLLVGAGNMYALLM
jgi:hypothetical protein